MATTFQCPCGHWLRGGTGSRAVDCPACGRTVVAGRGGLPPIVWIVVPIVVGFLVIAGGIVSALIATSLAKPTEPAQDIRSPEPAMVSWRSDFPTATVPTEPKPTAPIDEAPPPRPAPKPLAASPPVPPPIPDAKPTVEPAGRYRVGDAFDQEVVVSRRSAFRVLGVESASGAQYSFTSSVVVTKVNADGSLVAEQRIRAAKLLDADASMKAELTAALEKAQGAKFEISVNPAGDVTKLEGLKDPIRVLAGKDAMPGQSLRLWSLLDTDAWKELAGLTFFQPGKPLKAGVTWQRPAAHDWGPLGTWRGRTVYIVGKQQPKVVAERIDYAHDIYHRPAGAGADKELPFRVLKTEFKTVLASGAIAYDASWRRTTAAEETFRVRGAVLVSVGGVEAAIEMEELQGFRLTVTDRTKRELVGNPFEPRK